MHQSWKQQKSASDWLKLKGECTPPTRWEVRADAGWLQVQIIPSGICLSVCHLSIHPPTHWSLGGPSSVLTFSDRFYPHGKKDNAQHLWALICRGETIPSHNPYHSEGKVSVWPAWIPCHLVGRVTFQALPWLTHGTGASVVNSRREGSSESNKRVGDTGCL